MQVKNPGKRFSTSRTPALKSRALLKSPLGVWMKSTSQVAQQIVKMPMIWDTVKLMLWHDMSVIASQIRQRLDCLFIGMNRLTSTKILKLRTTVYFMRGIHRWPLQHQGICSWHGDVFLFFHQCLIEIISMALRKTVVTPLLMHLSYCSLPLNHRYHMILMDSSLSILIIL